MTRPSDPPATPLGEPRVGPASVGLLDDWDRLIEGETAEVVLPPLPGPAEAEAPESVRYLGFRVGREFYAVPIQELAEVVRDTEITLVPRLRPFVRGIISVRGTIVPIVDLRRRLAFESEDLATGPDSARVTAEGQRRILIANVAGESFGLLVDEVTHPFRLEPQEVEPPPVTLSRRLLEFVSGIGRVDDRIHILLDLGVVLRFDAIIPLRGRTEGAA